MPVERRTARFICVLALLHHPSDPTPLICQGCWEGVILTEPRGANGFGYDPVFHPTGFDCTFAEMSLSEKNAISHRGQAVKKLVDFLTNP